MRAIKLLSLGCGLIAILLKITADAQEIHYARRRNLERMDLNLMHSAQRSILTRRIQMEWPCA